VLRRANKYDRGPADRQGLLAMVALPKPAIQANFAIGHRID
jgi:hypothetical protein